MRGLCTISLWADDVQAATGLELPEGKYETLAGFLLERLGHLPVAGERVEHEGWRFLVLEMDRRRIGGVRVERPAPEEDR